MNDASRLKLGIASPTLSVGNQVLQEFQSRLIDDLNARIEHISDCCGEFDNRFSSEFPHKMHSSCEKSLEVARIYFDLLRNNPHISNDEFLEFHRLALDLAEEAVGRLNAAIAWHGATTGSARKKAFARHSADPKSVEKKFVEACWREWQKSKSKYKSKAAFARDMLEKCEHLNSQKKIEDWCREWEKKEVSVTLPAE